MVYGGSGQWDRPIWSPAAKVADELGIDRAHCFEVTNGCNGAMTAVQVALDNITMRRTEYALLLATSGRGFSWGITALEYQP